MYWFRQVYRPSFFFGFLAILLLSSPTPSDASIRLCGSRLTTTLLAVCRNQLCTGLTAFKRSADQSYAPTTRDLFHIHHQQKRGGIATECCEKRCSFAYLKTFCCNQDDN
ncbi:Insulin-like peptide INSL5 [Caenorhabditis elegans]|uniref:Insulin-like peptide INSL5 n=1 Tax=Caenorhabditis elegans TaxID=6239 RepID=G5EFY8_CAEEL|nr:Insulin-like domain-containing protein [Caenorhabditis elegans]AAC33275.1 insulin-like peptide [Caenorhabditis elegans]CAC42282.1 Insulin-like domain-containing protein [Caenorhabditis elegans]|eukprot:NP_501926.1 INSulin related [Caenorhabditis elegans]